MSWGLPILIHTYPHLLWLHIQTPFQHAVFDEANGSFLSRPGEGSQQGMAGEVSCRHDRREVSDEEDLWQVHPWGANYCIYFFVPEFVIKHDLLR